MFKVRTSNQTDKQKFLLVYKDKDNKISDNSELYPGKNVLDVFNILFF